MKKIFIFIFIFFLLIFTSGIKNSTKKIEKEIYNIKENIRILENNYEIVLLEYNYLSSPNKLSKFKNQFFKEDLNYFEVKNIKKVIIDSENNFFIKNFLPTEENDWKR